MLSFNNQSNNSIWSLEQIAIADTFIIKNVSNGYALVYRNGAIQLAAATADQANAQWTMEQ